MPDRVLGHLHQHRVTGAQGVLDGASLAGQAGRVPVHLTGIEHPVAPPADIDEGGLHAGQHVLHPGEVDVADRAGRAGPGHVVLDQDVVFQHRDLGAVAVLADRHHPLHRLPAGQELGLGQDRRPAPAGVPVVPAALALGLQPGRALDAAHAVVVGRAGLGPAAVADVHHGVGRIVVGGLHRIGAGGPPPPATPAGAGRQRRLGHLVGMLGVEFLAVLLGLGFLGGSVPTGLAGTLAATTPASPPTTTGALGLAGVGFGRLGVGWFAIGRLYLNWLGFLGRSRLAGASAARRWSRRRLEDHGGRDRRRCGEPGCAGLGLKFGRGRLPQPAGLGGGRRSLLGGPLAGRLLGRRSVPGGWLTRGSGGLTRRSGRGLSGPGLSGRGRGGRGRFARGGLPGRPLPGCLLRRRACFARARLAGRRSNRRGRIEVRRQSRLGSGFRAGRGWGGLGGGLLGWCLASHLAGGLCRRLPRATGRRLAAGSRRLVGCPGSSGAGSSSGLSGGSGSGLGGLLGRCLAGRLLGRSTRRAVGSRLVGRGIGIGGFGVEHLLGVLLLTTGAECGETRKYPGHRHPAAQRRFWRPARKRAAKSGLPAAWAAGKALSAGAGGAILLEAISSKALSCATDPLHPRPHRPVPAPAEWPERAPTGRNRRPTAVRREHRRVAPRE